jgi:tetratricopeptide (TPR) repeat protein
MPAMSRFARFTLVTLSCAVAVSALSAATQELPCRQLSYECAAADVKRGHFDAAIRTLAVVLERAPRNVNALHLLGVALTGAGRVDEANQRYLAALELEPSFYTAARNLGINEFNAGRLPEAAHRFEQVLARAPADPIAHLHLGEIAYQQSRFEAAIAHYRKSDTLVGEHGSWLLHFGVSLLKHGARGEALAALRRLPKDDAVSRFEAGLALAQAGAHLDASKFFASARSGYPDPYRAAYNQVLTLTQAGAYDEASRVSEELVQAGMGTAELYALASRAHLSSGRTRQATEALREAARLDPDREDIYIDLALICLSHSDYDLGLELIDLGLRQRPESSALHLHRGFLQSMRGEVADAEKSFEAARERSPQSPLPYTALAMLWIDDGRAGYAVAQLSAVHRRLADPVLTYAFALALIRTGIEPGGLEAVEALEALRSSARAKPTFAPAHTELGRLLLRRGEIEDAIVALERAVAADPNSPAALYNLAQAYRKHGDDNRARALIAKLAAVNAAASAANEAEDLKQLMFGVLKAPK